MVEIGGQFHSISHSGMAIFENPISTTIGGLVIDLASAPIEPGHHTLKINGGLGGIEVYLPSYVQFTVKGGPAVGGHDVHEGLGLWEKLTHKMQDILHLTEQIPDHAVANPNPEQKIRVDLEIDSVIGGIDIYRI